eukprot:g1192.t1
MVIPVAWCCLASVLESPTPRGAPSNVSRAGRPQKHLEKREKICERVADVAHTPWWILAGVTPEGPSIDMGTYKMSSFSKSQQERASFLKSLKEALKEADAYGQIVHWSRFTAATASLAPCAEPDDRQLGLNEAETMRLLGKALTIGWQRVQLEDAQLQDWMSQRSECQRSCMVKVIGFSLKTLWAVGEFSSASGQGAFAKALGDAVRACYPGFRALNIDHITQKVALYVGQELRKTHPQLASESGFATKPRALQQNDIEPCLSPGLDEEQRSSFIERMRAAVKEAISEARKRSVRDDSGSAGGSLAGRRVREGGTALR